MCSSAVRSFDFWNWNSDGSEKATGHVIMDSFTSSWHSTEWRGGGQRAEEGREEDRGREGGKRRKDVVSSVNAGEAESVAYTRLISTDSFTRHHSPLRENRRYLERCPGKWLPTENLAQQAQCFPGGERYFK